MQLKALTQRETALTVMLSTSLFWIPVSVVVKDCVRHCVSLTTTGSSTYKALSIMTYIYPNPSSSPMHATLTLNYINHQSLLSLWSEYLVLRNPAATFRKGSGCKNHPRRCSIKFRQSHLKFYVFIFQSLLYPFQFLPIFFLSSRHRFKVQLLETLNLCPITQNRIEFQSPHYLMISSDHCNNTQRLSPGEQRN